MRTYVFLFSSLICSVTFWENNTRKGHKVACSCVHKSRKIDLHLFRSSFSLLLASGFILVELLTGEDGTTEKDYLHQTICDYSMRKKGDVAAKDRDEKKRRIDMSQESRIPKSSASGVQFSFSPSWLFLSSTLPNFYLPVLSSKQHQKSSPFPPAVLPLFNGRKMPGTLFGDFIILNFLISFCRSGFYFSWRGERFTWWWLFQ